MFQLLDLKILLSKCACETYSEACKVRLAEIDKLPDIDIDWEDDQERLASKHVCYNVFQFPEFQELKKEIIKAIPFKFKNTGYGIKGWINYLQPGMDLRGHYHEYDLSGHITLVATNCSTVYEKDGNQVTIQSITGALHLFSPGVYHYVTANYDTQDRYSIAFDLIKPEQIDREYIYLLEMI